MLPVEPPEGYSHGITFLMSMFHESIHIVTVTCVKQGYTCLLGIDWQQDYLYPLVRGTNMKHLPWMNRIYYNYSSGNHLRGAGFSRWAGWGDHRHPIQFSGDAVGNWDLLRFEVDLTTTSGNAGCFFWAHDLFCFYAPEPGTAVEFFVVHRVDAE